MEKELDLLSELALYASKDYKKADTYNINLDKGGNRQSYKMNLIEQLKTKMSIIIIISSIFPFCELRV